MCMSLISTSSPAYIGNVFYFATGSTAKLTLQWSYFSGTTINGAAATYVRAPDLSLGMASIRLAYGSMG